MYPIIHPIEPFDSSVGTEIKFTWRGNQIYKVRCIVKNNETGVTVYDHTESTMKQSYTIPTNSGLINGVYYVVYITVFDVNNNESDLQDIGTPFYCFSKPKFNLSISDGEIIQTSAYKIGLNYSQAQGESLDSYSFTLYTYQKTVLSSSGDIYNTSDMSYVVTGLENAKQYYLRATGKTLHGITLDTGFILITVSYTIAQVFNTLELNNKPDSGAIEAKSNIVSTIGLSEKDVIYIGDEYADLRDNSVTFNEGFEVRGDFTKIFVFYEPERNKSIISFGDGDRLKVDIYYRKGKYADSNGEKAYFELVANSCGVNYVMNSNYVDIPSTSYQQFALLVNRQDAYYDLKVVVISTVIRYSASADGFNMTETKQTNSKYVGMGYMPKDVYEYENLQNGTKDFSSFNTPVGFSKLTEIHEGTTVLRRDSTTSGYSSCEAQLPNLIEAHYNEYYTISFYAKVDSIANLSTGFYIFLALRDENNKPTSVLNSKGLKSLIQSSGGTDGNWIKLTFGGLDTSQTSKYIVPIFRQDGNATGTNVYISSLKIEKGNKNTPWTPAPFDWVSDPNNYTWKPL